MWNIRYIEDASCNGTTFSTCFVQEKNVEKNGTSKNWMLYV